MEDFGYSKEKEEGRTSQVARKAFLIGATLFSIACFIYITISAYYFFSQDAGNIQTIHAQADPIKIVESNEPTGETSMQIDNSIYEDIFGTRKKEKTVKVVENAQPALPPKKEELVEKELSKPAQTIINKDNTQFVTSSSNQAKKPPQSGKIIVYSDGDIKNTKNLLDDKITEKTVEKKDKIKDQKRHIKVQIAALTSKKSAEEYFSKLQKQTPNLFDNLKSYVEEVDLGKRGIFYRVQVGNFFDQVKAESFCRKYISQAHKSKADCIVVE